MPQRAPTTAVAPVRANAAGSAGSHGSEVPADARPPALAQPREPDGTLLAVVPVPGTATSLVVVGYLVTTPAARPAADRGQQAAGVVVDREQRRAWAGGREITLTYQEFELLDEFTRHPGRLFSRAELLTRAWKGAIPASTRTVDLHVSRLRRKLGPGLAHCLSTEFRAGYRFLPS
jgi:DNA-binding response OmpR family regulator